MAMSTDRFTVLGRYPDLVSARRAIDALQDGGIDEKDVDVRGPGMRRAERADENRLTWPRDERIIWHVVRRVVVAGVLGALAGIGASLVFSAVFDSGPMGSNYAANAASWGAGGALLFGLPTLFASVSQGKGWEMSFEPGVEEEGEVVIALRSGDEALARKAEDILRGHGAGHIRTREV